jgi:chemotaxis protein histidine kinase CheA/ActR/RegA family two-component response regulator
VSAALWDDFIARSRRDAALLVAALATPGELPPAAQIAFRIALSCLGIGAEPIGRLALAIEYGCERHELLDEGPRAALAQAIAMLEAAFVQLANPDRSGARVEDLPLAEQAQQLEDAVASTAGPVQEAPPRWTPPVPEAAPAAAPVHDAGFTWAPVVDDDMVELFFDEATARIEALAGKLVDLERAPGDRDLLRDVFRDLHTVKGSSAMVGLAPLNELAHAAEDLVGQIRDAGRAVDGPVIDALLAALDALRDLLDRARRRAPLPRHAAPAIARLRNPLAATAEIPIAAVVPVAAQAHVAAVGAPTIRVDFEKLDRLMNLVGELVLGRDQLRGAVGSLGSVTTEVASARSGVAGPARLRVVSRTNSSRLQHLGDELSRVERVLADVTTDLDRGTDRLDAISGELRQQVMRLRMVPVTGVFRKHVRTVRDLAATLGKRARLALVGEDTELDKLLVEALDEPLMHLVRNAVDHGIESPEVRTAVGKPAEGTVTLAAAHRGNQVEIRVADDGRGLDPEKLKAKARERGVITEAEAEALDERGARELVFRAGFSTAAHVSEVSGRGVGMDIVRQAIVARLKGTIEVESTVGQGSAFVLKLPLTLAIIQVVVARAGGETFAIPLDVVQRVLAIPAKDVEVVGDREVISVRGKAVPLIRIDAVLELDAADPDLPLQLVMVAHGGASYALACEHLIGKREIVIKSLGKLLSTVPCVAGATLLGDRVALILDVPAIVQRALAAPPGRGPRTPAAIRPQLPSASTILLVEDSDIVRESLRRILVDAGYIVTVAFDGAHGLELAKARRFDLVSTDVMMPRLDGYELTRALRALPEYADTPIVMVTSMGERIDRVRGFDAGVDEYITKPHDRTQLVRVVRKLLGHAAGGHDA